MLHHLRITGKDILPIKRLQEIAIDKHAQRLIKCTDFVFQSIEIDSGLSPYSCIN